MQRTRSDNSPEVQIFDVELWLPSAIGHQVDCSQVFQEIEWALREAQANDALNSIRQHLRLDSFLTKQKKDWAHGVKANTQSIATIELNRSKIRAAVEKYRTSRKALSKLEPFVPHSSQWKKVLRELADDDIRGLPVGGVGEGTRTLSWIWMAQGVLGNETDDDKDPSLHDGGFLRQRISCRTLMTGV